MVKPSSQFSKLIQIYCNVKLLSTIEYTPYFLSGYKFFVSFLGLSINDDCIKKGFSFRLIN